MNDETMTESNHSETPNSWSSEQLAEAGIDVVMDWCLETNRYVRAQVYCNGYPKTLFLADDVGGGEKLSARAYAEATRIARERQAENRPKVWWVGDNEVGAFQYPLIITPEGVVGETPEDELKALEHWLARDGVGGAGKLHPAIHRIYRRLSKANAAIAAAREGE